MHATSRFHRGNVCTIRVFGAGESEPAPYRGLAVFRQADDGRWVGEGFHLDSAIESDAAARRAAVRAIRDEVRRRGMRLMPRGQVVRGDRTTAPPGGCCD